MKTLAPIDHAADRVDVGGVAAAGKNRMIGNQRGGLRGSVTMSRVLRGRSRS
jgi:hypothetical protein